MSLAASEVDRLIEAARAVYGEFTLGDGLGAGSCAAAILSADGHIYTGICMDLHCGIGFCAEHAAVAEMLKARETRIIAVVAVAVGGNEIAPPCGRCRELMIQIDDGNLDTQVILGRDTIKLLRELLPDHWLSSGRWNPAV